MVMCNSGGTGNSAVFFMRYVLMLFFLAMLAGVAYICLEAQSHCVIVNFGDYPYVR